MAVSTPTPLAPAQKRSSLKGGATPRKPKPLTQSDRKSTLAALEREFAPELTRISGRWSVSRATASAATKQKKSKKDLDLEESVEGGEPPATTRMIDVAEALDMPGTLLGAMLVAKCRDQQIAATKERQQRFAEFVLSNCSGTMFRMSDCNVGPECAEVVATGLALCSRYTQLNLSHNSLGDAGAKAIAQALKDLDTLQLVDLSANDIGAAGACAVFKAMLVNSSVTSLDLSSKAGCVRNRLQMKEKDSTTMEAMLIHNKTLRHLNLAATSLGPEGLQFLARGLVGNRTLLNLDISQNGAGNRGAAYLAEALKACSLQELNLAENRIGDEGFICLATAMGALPNRPDGAESNPVWSRAIEPTKACAKYLDALGFLRRIVLDVQVEELFAVPEIEGQVAFATRLAEAAAALQMAVRAAEVSLPHLKLLNVSQNTGTAIGHRSLVDALHVNSCVEKILMDNCDQRDPDNGYFALIVSLPGNTSLRHLSLQNALLGPTGLVNLAKVIAVNKALRHLNLSGNLVDESTAAAWAIALRGNSELRQLYLNGCHLHDASGRHLADSLITNCGLETLSMRDNSLRDDAAEAFGEALLHNGSVTQLNLELNSIDYRHLQTIKHLLARNEKIRQGKLPDCYRSRIQELHHCKSEVERMTHVLVRNRSRKRKALWKQAAKVQTLKDEKEADWKRQASVEENLQELLVERASLDEEIAVLEAALSELRAKGEAEVSALSAKITETEDKISMGEVQVGRMRTQLEKFEMQASIELRGVREQLDKALKAQQSASLLSTAARRNLATFSESLDTIGQDIAGGVNPRQRWVEAPSDAAKASAKTRSAEAANR